MDNVVCSWGKIKFLFYTISVSLFEGAKSAASPAGTPAEEPGLHQPADGGGQAADGTPLQPHGGGLSQPGEVGHGPVLLLLPPARIRPQQEAREVQQGSQEVN